jgi:hypothetical protein
MPAELFDVARKPLGTSWHDPLQARGFVFTGTGYEREGLRFDLAGRWLVLSEPPDPRHEFAPATGRHQFGLWKWAQNGAAPHRVFEIPSWVVARPAADDHFDDREVAPFARLLDWALESRLGRLPSAWQPPQREVVESWLPRGALTVQAKGLVRQGELTLRPDRWALGLPILPQLPNDLPEPRHRALRELLFEAQSRWAMLRFEFSAGTDQSALIGTVDFTGAPHSELLFSAGLDVLRHVVVSLVETAEVLAEASTAIASLSLDCNQNKPNERKEP